MRNSAILACILLAACGGSKENKTPVDTTLPDGTKPIASADLLTPASENPADIQADLNAAANDAIADVNAATSGSDAAAALDAQGDALSNAADRASVAQMQQQLYLNGSPSDEGSTPQ
jgi:hypothetical protein